MIRIGFSAEDKQNLIYQYLDEHHEVHHVIVFQPEQYDLPGPFEKCTWADITRQERYQQLLDKIDDGCLIVVSELLRSKDRSDPTYRCLQEYLIRTAHRIIFQYYPVIDAPEDLLILADMDCPEKYEGRSLTPTIMRELHVRGYDRRPSIQIDDVPVPDGALAAYIKERDALFAYLGNADPDVVPRNLHLWCGQYKRPLLQPDKLYLARDQRFKLPNVATYKDARDAGRISIDLPYRRIELNDYLCLSGADRIEFLATPFEVDHYYASELQRWHDMVGEIYFQTNIRR